MGINKPELETLDYKPEQPKEPEVMVDIDNDGNVIPISQQPPSVPLTVKLKINPDGELKIEVENKEVAEQPNKELMVVKKIQGLTTEIYNNLDKLKATKPRTINIIAQAIEDIDIFERTTLFDLQKEYK